MPLVLWSQDLQTVFLRDITPGQVFVFVKEQKLTVQVLDVDVSGAVHSLPDRSTQAVRPGGLIQDQGHSAGKGAEHHPVLDAVEQVEVWVDLEGHCRALDSDSDSDPG